MKDEIYVALLRGINVGGKTMVRMADLKICLEKLGFRQVSTYINSGNVIFKGAKTNPRQLETIIERALTTAFKLSIKVVVRSRPEMRQLINSLPKSWQDTTSKRCSVIFLRHTIDKPDIVRDLRPKPEIEELYYHPGTLFWSANTSDLTKSGVAKLHSQPMYQEMTVRNLNTARKIYELMLAAS